MKLRNQTHYQHLKQTIQHIDNLITLVNCRPADILYPSPVTPQILFGISEQTRLTCTLHFYFQCFLYRVRHNNNKLGESVSALNKYHREAHPFRITSPTSIMPPKSLVVSSRGLFQISINK